MSTRIVHNKVLGGWYVVTGVHQSPISSRFDSKQDAQEWLHWRAYRRDHWAEEPPVSFKEWKEMQ